MDVSKNLRMIIVNDADKANLSLSVGSEVASLPLTNVQNNLNSRVFRTADVAQVQIAMTFDEPTILSGLVLWRHNLSDAATWQIELFSDVAMTQPITDGDSGELQAVEQKTLGEHDWLLDTLVSAVVNTKLRASNHWFSSEAVQAVRITVKDPLNDYGFIDIGRIYSGIVLQPLVNFSYGHSLGWASQSQKKTTAGGSTFSKKRARPRKLSFSLDWISELERPHFFNAINRTGDDTDMYLSMYPEYGGQKEMQYAMACMFTTLPDFNNIHHDTYSTQYNVQEV